MSTRSVSHAPIALRTVRGRSGAQRPSCPARPADGRRGRPRARSGKIAGSGVARATTRGTPRNTWIPGVIAMPPPTPKIPARIPDARPTATAIATSPGLTAASRRLERARRAHPGTRRASTPARAGTIGSPPSRRRDRRRRRRCVASGRSARSCGSGRPPRRRSSASPQRGLDLARSPVSSRTSRIAASSIDSSSSIPLGEPPRELAAAGPARGGTSRSRRRRGGTRRRRRISRFVGTPFFFGAPDRVFLAPARLAPVARGAAASWREAPGPTSSAVASARAGRSGRSRRRRGLLGAGPLAVRAGAGLGGGAFPAAAAALRAARRRLARFAFARPAGFVHPC